MRSNTLPVFGIVIAAAAVAFGVSTPVSAATYFVRVSGNDANNGTSAATAFKTVKKAATVAVAGDTVWVGAGTYTDAVTISNHGTAAMPIRLMSDLTGVNTGDAGIARISGMNITFTVRKNYISIIGFEFGGFDSSSGLFSEDDDDISTGATATIRFDSCVGGLLQQCQFFNGKDACVVDDAAVIAQNCLVYNFAKNGFVVNGSSKLTVQNSVIRNCDQRGVFIKRGTQVLIEDSTITSCGNHGIRSEADNTSDTLVLRRCELANNRDGLHLHGKSRVTCENCLFANNREDGIHIHSGSVVFLPNHCTIASNGRDGVLVQGGSCTITNSIVAFNVDDGLDRDSGTCTNSYNLVYGNQSQNYENVTAGVGCLSVHPKFVIAGDFHLQSSSPAIDKATGTMAVDLDNRPRPYGPAVDMGCYEGIGGGSEESSFGKEYFVRVTGNDSKDGRTPGKAFRTIAKAVSVMISGDTIYVGSGTYTESPDVTAKVGGATAPIKLVADLEGGMTGDRGPVTLQGGFYLRNSAYVKVEGFGINVNATKPAWAPVTAGVYANQSTGISVSDVAIAGGGVGIQGQASPSMTIANCRATSASSHGFAFTAGSTGSVVNCTATSNGGAGFYVGSGTVGISGSASSNNASRGYHYDSSRGTVSNCSSRNDALAADFLGMDNNQTNLTISNLLIESSNQGALRLQNCTAQVLGGSQPMCTGGGSGATVINAGLSLRDAVIRSTIYGIQASNATNVHLSNCNISLCSFDGVYANGSVVNLTGCSISGCRNGALGENSSTLTATASNFDNSRAWGISHSGYGSITDCVLNNNVRGITVTGAVSRGDIAVNNTRIQGTTLEALSAIRCTGNLQAGSGKLARAGSYGVYLRDCDFTLPNVEITGPQYGIQSFSSSLNLSGALISDCQYDGLYMDAASSTLSNCTISGCRYAVNSLNNGMLAADLSTFQGSRAWAIVHSGTGSVTNCQVRNNYQGVYLTGAVATGDVSLVNTTIEGSTREGLVAIRCTGDVVTGSGQFSSGGSYGAYLSESNLTIPNLQIAGPTYGILSYSSTLNLTNATITDCSAGAIYGTGANTTLTNCTIARCLHGVNTQSASTLVATNTTIDACTGWGINHSGYGSLTDCIINNCNQGANLTGASQPTDIQLANTRIQGTVQEGLIAVRCSGTVVGGSSNLSASGAYGAYLSQSNLSLTGITITGTQRGVVSLNSTVALNSASISGTTQTGVYAETSSVTLANCTVSGCGSRGVDCQLQSTVHATGTTIENCSDWGLAVSGFGTITTCEVRNNTYGANLVGDSVRGDIGLTDLTIRGCGNQGLIAVRCDGTVLGGSGMLSSGGSSGVFVNDSHLTLSNARISGSTNGIQSTYSNLTIANAEITNTTTAVRSDRDDLLLLDTARIDNCTSWSVHQLQGTLQANNCLVTRAASGLRFDNVTQANVWNATLVSSGSYGVFQDGGAVDLKNTIVVGNNQGTGLHRAAGVMTTSHNLVFGFTTSFSGVTPDADTLTKNPRFNNAGAGDYSLGNASPAINGGIDLVGYVDRDLLGQSRPAFNRWDIGAYEYFQPNGSVRVLQWAERR